MEGGISRQKEREPECFLEKPDIKFRSDLAPKEIQYLSLPVCLMPCFSGFPFSYLQSGELGLACLEIPATGWCIVEAVLPVTDKRCHLWQGRLSASLFISSSFCLAV